MPRNENRKSVLWAYTLWLFGGIFGLHLFYLERDAHAFLTWSTLGGYGLGWLSDVTKIPRYVRDANNDPTFLEEFIQKVRKNRKPPFSTSRFLSAITVGYFWGQLVLMAIPEEEFGGINWKFLQWLVPAAVTSGVWIVGNIGREMGSPWKTLAVSYISYLLRWHFYDESIWLTTTVFAAALAFDSLSKHWRRKPREKRSWVKRILLLSLCSTVYLSIWGGYFYFNGKITDSNGDEIPVHEALHHFFTSPWWTDLKQSLYDVYIFAQHHGWYEVWKQIIDLTDPQGEQNAYKVLGLSPTVSQSEITSKWRHLSREWHPDKVKDPSLKSKAQETFMEIQQAYDILSSIKSKRKRQNKKSID
ncbi:hypothetical protein FQA39_LY09226 [Lamprigera yunnana]|nr:hypothetical protein FQA39_LY09226 [Lamprigera yunnana]